MTKIYTIESEEGITTVRFTKKSGLIDLLRAIDDIEQNYLSRLRLWDISCGVSLTNNQIIELAEYAKSKFTIPSKVAFVAPTDFSFGLARVLEVYREDNLAEQMAFRSKGEARDWLKKSKTD